MDQLLRSHADAIIKASITAVLPDEAVKRALDGQTFPGRVLLVSAGKAAWQMAKAAYDFWGQRIENGVSVCALKTPCPEGGRCEWETECGDITAAIPALIEMGAPAELAELTAGGLEALCSARFTRQAALIELDGCTVELALDRGFLKGGFRMNLMMEVEVELKEGTDEAAVTFAKALAEEFGLIPEEKSKFARAMALAMA